MNIERSVLLAEDDPNDVYLLQHAFEHAEIQNPWQVVRDGQEAINYLSGAGAFADRNRFPFPHLLILDLKMPRKTGMEVLQWLRSDEVLCSLPTMMLSSSAHPSDREKAYELGVNAFVVKPSGISERLELARMIKGFWLTFNEPPLISTDGLDAAREAQIQRNGKRPES